MFYFKPTTIYLYIIIIINNRVLILKIVFKQQILCNYFSQGSWFVKKLIGEERIITHHQQKSKRKHLFSTVHITSLGEASGPSSRDNAYFKGSTSHPRSSLTAGGCSTFIETLASWLSSSTAWCSSVPKIYSDYSQEAKSS